MLFRSLASVVILCLGVAREKGLQEVANEGKSRHKARGLNPTSERASNSLTNDDQDND